ncbi:MAG: ATP-binding protein, partial [Myxococcota bacterium]
AENAGPRGALSLPLLDEALAGTQRVARIVQDLLALARPSEEVWEVVHVEDVASAAIRLASTTCGSSLRVETRLDGLPPVRTNGARLGQVLLNLVVNALQALRGHADPRVTLSGRVDGDRVVLALEDNGPGIPATILPRVYDPFFTTKAPGHGAGLGLTVSHAIVTTLGGTLRVTSAESQGTTVFVELPVGTPQEVPAPAPSPAPAATAPTTRVLLVDDEQAVTRVLTALLGDTHQTAACHDPTQALTLLATDRRWDAVICDLRMPGLSGAALYTRVKQLDPAVAARFVFTTGGALENADADIVAESGRPLLAKPFTRKRLLAAIDTVIAGGRASAAV